MRRCVVSENKNRHLVGHGRFMRGKDRKFSNILYCRRCHWAKPYILKTGQKCVKELLRPDPRLPGGGEKAMREIKFRAWHPKGTEANGRLGYEYTYWKLGSGLDNTVFFHQALAVEQFTGILDKNGKEIYDGDIVVTNESDWKAKVVYDRGGFFCVDTKGGFSSECEWEKCEVIGNIHENPELTEEKKP